MTDALALGMGSCFGSGYALVRLGLLASQAGTRWRVLDRPAPLDVFVGRTAELGHVAEVVALVQSGQPWLVAIEGDPGVGKTALARRCLAQARGLRVLSARGDQAETDLDFGLADQLFRAAGGGIGPVPPAAGTGPAASSFAVGARLLEVVGEQQAAGAVAIVVDDLQWADRRSMEALTFMLRRLSVDPVVAVVIYRGPGGLLDGPARRMLRSVENRARIPLGGLGPDEVASLAAALMAEPLDPWHDDAALDGRSRMYAVLWRPLLAEGLIGSGQAEQAAVVLDQLRAGSGQVSYIQPALAWLDGWLAEQRDHPEEALRIYQLGEGTVSTRSPVHTARLLLAHGRLLRRTGNRKDAVERLRRAHALFSALRAAPLLARTEAELAECHLSGGQAKKQSVLALTSRETEVAHLVGKGLSNPEIAAELFISRKAVEYHLGNIYAKCGVQGRQQLRRFVDQWRQPAAV